jgi:DNA-binding MarR family transcriptional regulator
MSATREKQAANQTYETNAEPCNCSALRRAARRVSLLYDRHLAGSGLTSGQYSMLAEIRRQGKQSPTVCELAQALVMDRTALTHSLKPLERDGMIQLKASPADRRAKLICITALGEKKFTTARALWREAQQEFNQSLGRKQAVALRGLLQSFTTAELITTEPA